MNIDFLSDAEKTKLESFNEDALLQGAIKKFLLYYTRTQGVFLKGEALYNPLENSAFHPYAAQRANGNIDFEAVGKEVGLIVEATKLVEEAFGEMSRYKKENKVEKSKKNPAL